MLAEILDSQSLGLNIFKFIFWRRNPQAILSPSLPFLTLVTLLCNFKICVLDLANLHSLVILEKYQDSALIFNPILQQ